MILETLEDNFSFPLQFWVVGIHTDIGKTYTASAICRKWDYSYWKPIQCGEAELVDVLPLPTLYQLKSPISPHLAFLEEKKKFNFQLFKKTFLDIQASNQKLIIEGAGGILTPLSESITFIDLIQWTKLPVVLVTRPYLGHFNHTLLSLRILKNYRIPIHTLIGANDAIFEREIYASN